MKYLSLALSLITASILTSFGATGTTAVPYQQLNPHHFDTTVFPLVTLKGLNSGTDLTTDILNLVGGTNFWKYDTNTGTLEPNFNPGFVAMTNAVTYGNYLQRAVQFLGTHSYTLALGANNIAMTDFNLVSVIGTTATASDTTLNVDNGNGFGQYMILRNISTNLATFTMPMTQVQSGDATKTNRLGSIWIPTQRGESLVLYNDGFGWRETGRTVGTNQTENLWQNLAGTLQPINLALPVNVGTNLNVSGDTFTMFGQFAINAGSGFNQVGGSSVTLALSGQSSSVDIDNQGMFAASSAIPLGKIGAPWGPLIIGPDNNGSDYSLLKISHTTTNGPIEYLSIGVGTAGPPRAHHFDTDNTVLSGNLLEVANAGSGELSLMWDGELYGPTILTTQTNTALGYAAFNGASGSRNVAIGQSAMNAGSGNSRVAIGYLAMNSGGQGDDVAIGDQALKVTTVSGNTAVGALAGLSVTTGGENSLFGSQAGQGIITGTHNVWVGDYAPTSLGYNSEFSVVIGSIANQHSDPLTNLSSSVLIGYFDKTNVVTGLTNVIAIGMNVIPTSNNEIRIGNHTNTTVVLDIASNTGTGNNVLRDDNTFGAVPGGGGDTIWTNKSGVIESLVTPGYFAIQTNGCIVIGTNTTTVWGAPLTETLMKINDISKGDADNTEIFVAVSSEGTFDDMGSLDIIVKTNNVQFNLAVDISGVGPAFTASVSKSAGGGVSSVGLLDYNNQTAWLIRPTEPDGSVVEYINTTVTHTFGNLSEKSNNGSLVNSVRFDGMTTASGGFSSLSTNAPVPITATGWTNSFGKSAVVSLTATAATWTKKNNAGSLISTNATVFSGDSELYIQSGGSFQVTAGTVAGVANPF